MNAQPAKRRRGRPRLPKGQKKPEPMSFRPTPDIRTKLEAAAAASGRSMTREIDSRIERTFLEDDFQEGIFGGERLYWQARHIALAINLVEEYYGSTIENDSATLLAVQEAVERVLELLAKRRTPSSLIKFRAGEPTAPDGRQIVDAYFSELAPFSDDKAQEKQTKKKE